MNKLIITEKEIQYFDYIQEHKRNVLLAYNIILESEDFYNGTQGATIIDLDKSEIEELKRRVIEHDLSKFSKLEFSGYREYFYPEEESEKSEIKFNEAWVHHYQANAHHPEHHNKELTKIDMLEMCIDWIAISIKFNDNAYTYYKKKKNKLTLEFGSFLDYEYIDFVLRHV